MEPIKIADYVGYSQGGAVVKANFTKEGTVIIWFQYAVAGRRQEFEITAQHWDRLVAWVEWQRREAELQKE